MHKDTESNAASMPVLTTPSTGKVVLKFGDAQTGTLVGFTAHHEPLVDFPGNAQMQPVAARACVALAATDVGRQVVVLFDGGDPMCPLIMGLLQCPVRRTDPAAVEVEAEVDGRHVRVVAQDKLTLQCGRARITLTRDGRVEIDGTHVQSTAVASNRIQGGSVQIN